MPWAMTWRNCNERLNPVVKFWRKFEVPTQKCSFFILEKDIEVIYVMYMLTRTEPMSLVAMDRMGAFLFEVKKGMISFRYVLATLLIVSMISIETNLLPTLLFSIGRNYILKMENLSLTSLEREVSMPPTWNVFCMPTALRHCSFVESRRKYVSTRQYEKPMIVEYIVL